MKNLFEKSNDFYRLNLPHLSEENQTRLEIDSEEGIIKWDIEEMSAERANPPAKTAKIFQDIKKIDKKSPVVIKTRSFFYTFLSFCKFALATTIIFCAVFFGMNWKAYNQIFKSWLSKGYTLETNILIPKEEPKLLEISKNPEIQKTQIPEIDLNIIPPDTRVFIPRINKNVPIVPVPSENLLKKDWDALEKNIQEALKDGVIHYPKTAWPGEKGNIFITGHSSYYPWAEGDFKEVFALLHDVQMNDKIEIHYKQQKYTYEVFDIKVVKPEQIDILDQTDDYILTLMTCTPVGTNWKRLVVVARQIEGPRQ